MSGSDFVEQVKFISGEAKAYADDVQQILREALEIRLLRNPGRGREVPYKTGADRGLLVTQIEDRYSA